MRLITACLLCTLALPAAAQIYKYTDANGNTVFTNQAPEGQDAETVNLPPTNTVEAQQPTRPVETSKPAQAQSAYTVLQLTDLPSDEALRANNGTFSVGVKLEPKLKPGHLLRLILDGQPYGQPSNVPRLQLVNIDRGEHSLAVEVLSGQQQIQQSASVTFTVQRISTNSPARPKPTPAPTPRPKPTPN
ncbi:DUF4124 domain-containing protein [Aquipseudomonas ullengensis]|uniref:DUF4124 domain-containing protein n=1 Tax=Aquipseudomonas ullengensis TaxID=2759166 RepID=A0A7W4QBC6_9GAMM|nr:DUF4124 domain-containing protein [Pseudomonas ullengensis]MBB2496787.1 DUF4124 domain-containing protein [Pseudomonas ullengensis]